MAESGETSLMGPAVFVGLSVFVLVTQGAPEVVFLDPAETMDMGAAAVPAEMAKAVAVSDIVVTAGVLAQGGVAQGGVVRSGGDALPVAAPEVVFAGLRALPVPEVGGAVAGLPGADVTVYDQVFEGWGAGPVLATPAPLPLAAPVRFLPPVDAHMRVVVRGDLVRVRVAAGLEAEILGQVNTGDLGLVLEFGGAWTLVQFARAGGPLTGWVSGDFLEAQK